METTERSVLGKKDEKRLKETKKSHNNNAHGKMCDEERRKIISYIFAQFKETKVETV